MKLTGCPLIVLISVLLAAAAAGATRPHYGGTLHMQVGTRVDSLDAADNNQPDVLSGRNIPALIFGTLVALNDQGQPQPALAISWRSDSGNQRWEFVLRPGVTFSDGTQMTPEAVTASLRRANPSWKILPQETEVVIQLGAPSPDLPAELALPRNMILKLDGGKALGTGPFVVSQWDPGKKLVLVARDDYWGGRPFLDSVEIQMAKNFRDETLSYDLGQSQVIQIPPEQARHQREAGELRVSQPIELVALLFADEVRSPEEAKQRQALALSIDRSLLNRVVLQSSGEAAGGLLPDWLSGYGFLFPEDANLTRAQQLRAELPKATAWNLSFDANDALARVLAERIALNASDAGLRLQLNNQSTPDVRLVRIPLASLDPYLALTQIANALELPPPRFLGTTIDDLYHAENAMLQSQRVIPLLHLRTAWAVSKGVRDWENARDGSWRLPDVWLLPGKP